MQHQRSASPPPSPQQQSSRFAQGGYGSANLMSLAAQQYQTASPASSDRLSASCPQDRIPGPPLFVSYPPSRASSSERHQQPLPQAYNRGGSARAPMASSSAKAEGSP